MTPGELRLVILLLIGQGWDSWGQGLGGSGAAELMLQLFSAFNLVALAVVSALFIWEGGIAVYGSILGGALGVFLYCKAKKRSFAALMDITAPGLALAQAIGRWGNYFNREAFGPVIQNPVWQFFPAGVLIDEGGAQVDSKFEKNGPPMCPNQPRV